MASSERAPIYAVRADAVPVRIEAFEFGRADYRIRFGRGIGWAPKRWTTREAVLKALLAMKSYGPVEARMAKAICRNE